VVLPDSYEVSRASKYSGPPLNEPEKFYLRGYHPLWPAFPGRSTIFLVCNSSATPYCRLVKTYNPEHTTHTGLAYVRFGLFPFRSPLLGESKFLSLPRGTEMSHFPPLASIRLCIQRRMTEHDSRRVSPFGHPRVEACLQLTEAYRSLPRPSSPSRAKASTVRP
jgi:hypothetical protein